MIEFEKAIAAAIQEAARRITTDEVIKCQKEIERRVREASAGICANVVRHMTFEHRGVEMVVTLRIPENKSS